MGIVGWIAGRCGSVGKGRGTWEVCAGFCFNVSKGGRVRRRWCLVRWVMTARLGCGSACDGGV